MLSEKFGTAVLEATRKWCSLVQSGEISGWKAVSNRMAGRTRAGQAWEGMGSYTNTTAQGSPAPERWSCSYLEARLYGRGSAQSHKMRSHAFGVCVEEGTDAQCCRCDLPAEQPRCMPFLDSSQPAGLLSTCNLIHTLVRDEFSGGT